MKLISRRHSPGPGPGLSNVSLSIPVSLIAITGDDALHHGLARMQHSVDEPASQLQQRPEAEHKSLRRRSKCTTLGSASGTTQAWDDNGFLSGEPTIHEQRVLRTTTSRVIACTWEGNARKHASCVWSREVYPIRTTVRDRPPCATVAYLRTRGSRRIGCTGKLMDEDDRPSS